ncbi:chaperone modulatory protein CbpM [Marinobacter daqiaonensis]|uniref:Chaperone modulatory protein CbpM n=1 Tax=Marinobacter daqiaonensis TaxID=650891 RepID=A0A1I6HMC3_9GAMM|nr:chaperone modulator CbpM [Marinobacter daqiaonensis]SFR55611.1 chaperone modulatory protein CbpM [Marinobacter daqiaonensis]
MSRKETIVTVELDDPAGTFTLREICERGECHAEFVIKLVSHGVISPIEDSPNALDWTFDLPNLARLQRARRLQRDLEINLPGLAMSLDLLDEVRDMRREVDRLNRLLDQFITD